MAAVNEYVCTAEAKCRTSAVYLTVFNENVFVIISRNAVVTCVEFALSDDNVLAGGDMNTVVTGFIDDIFDENILCVLNSLRPVARISCRISAKNYMLAVYNAIP